MNCKFTMKPKFAFKCPNHPNQDHLCVIPTTIDGLCKMRCQQDLKKNVAVSLKDGHKVWFEKIDFPRPSGKLCIIACQV